jgi:hypothetical protein
MLAIHDNSILDKVQKITKGQAEERFRPVANFDGTNTYNYAIQEGLNKAAYTISAEMKNTLGLHVGTAYESNIISLASSPKKEDKDKAKTTEK